MARVLLVCDIPDAGLLLEVEAFLSERWRSARRLAAGVFEGELGGKLPIDLGDYLGLELPGRLSRALPAGSRVYRVSANVVWSSDQSGQSFCQACKEFFPSSKPSGELVTEVYFKV